MQSLDQLCAVAKANRELAEDTARLAPDVRKAASEARLWFLVAPKEVGGAECPFPELFPAHEKIARADSAVAWHLINSHTVAAKGSYLSKEEQSNVYSAPDQPFALSASPQGTALPVEGGYILNAHWPFMTGALDASWCSVMSYRLNEDGGQPDQPDIYQAIVPLSELDIRLTWNEASGMRGTGSHAVSANDVFVPESRCFRISKPSPDARPLFRIPEAYRTWGLSAAVAVGTLHSGIDAATELCHGKVSRLVESAHYDEMRVQQAIADATAGVTCLSAGLRSLAEESWEAFVGGESPSDDLKARYWATVLYTFDACRELVSRLYAVGTSATYGTRNGVDRALRDLHAFSAAFESMQFLRKTAGKILLGHETSHPLF